jgi:methylated-DNA-[protein]-cysteine S-methyltransferase
MELQLTRIDSPLGEISLATDAEGKVWALDFTKRVEGHTRTHASSQAAEKIAEKIDAYFKGELDALKDIPVMSKGTDLERRVWEALRKIAPGSTTTYGELARGLGFDDPRMAKEVGAAIGANPVALIVPCHRVIGKDRSLRGYAWGLQRKQWLLAHEEVDLQRGLAFQDSA